MKLISLAILALGGAVPLLAVGTASAAVETFDWELTGLSPSLGYAPLQGGGTLTASSNGDGSWTVEAVTGEVGGETISGVTTYYLSNNLVYPGSQELVSTGGFAFVTDTGADVDIFSFYGQGSVVSPGNNYGEMSSAGFGVGTFTMTAAVPELSTWAMMGVGFAALAFAGYRKTRPTLVGLNG
jgi:hypothetical protein